MAHGRPITAAQDNRKPVDRNHLATFGRPV
jgi:hypothetical protein